MNKFTDEDVTLALTVKYESSRIYQTGKGVKFDFTVSAFLSLWTKYHRDMILNTLNRFGSKGLEKFFRHPEKSWVLSWTSGKPQPVMHAGNATIMTRKASRRNAQFKKDDRHTADAKVRIGAPKKDIPLTPGHIKAISAAKMGHIPSDGGRANMSAAASRRWAKKRGEIIEPKDEVFEPMLQTIIEPEAVAIAPTVRITPEQVIEQLRASAQFRENARLRAVERSRTHNEPQYQPEFELHPAMVILNELKSRQSGRAGKPFSIEGLGEVIKKTRPDLLAPH